jgi:hypothetical protein
VWDIKEPFLLKAVSVKHRSKFAALAVTGNGDSHQIAEKLLVPLYKQSNKQADAVHRTGTAVSFYTVLVYEYYTLIKKLVSGLTQN